MRARDVKNTDFKVKYRAKAMWEPKGPGNGWTPCFNDDDIDGWFAYEDGDVIGYRVFKSKEEAEAYIKIMRQRREQDD